MTTMNLRAVVSADVRDFKKGMRDVEKGLAKIGTATGVTQLASALTGAAQRVVVMGGAITAAAGAAVELGAAIAPVAGTMAALPGLAATAAQGIGAMAVAMHGVGNALGAYGKVQESVISGQTAEAYRNHAKAIRDAQRGIQESVYNAYMTQRQAGQRLDNAQHDVLLSQERLTDSVRTAKRAQESLSDTRVEAKRKLEDLTRSVERSALTEGRGILSVQEARLRLNKILADPRSTELERREARLSYQEAAANLTDIRTQNQRNAEDQAKAAKKGVEGSYAVQDALQAIVESQRAVREATRGSAQAAFDNRTAQIEVAHSILKAQQALADSYQNLADLQKNWAVNGAPGISAYNAAMRQLSPNAKDFVKTMERLSPRFKEMRKEIQDSFFGKLNFDLKSGNSLISTFGGSLKKIAGALGEVGHGLLGLFQTAGFQKDYAKMTDNNASSLHSFGISIREFVAGFARFAAVMGPLQKALSDGWASMGERFNKWAHSITPEQATKFSHTVMTSLHNVGKVLGELIKTFAILGKAAFGAGNDTLVGMGKGLEGFNKFLESAKGQARLKTFFDTIRTGFHLIGQALSLFVKGVGKVLDFVKYIQTLMKENPKLKAQAEHWAKIALVVGGVGLVAGRFLKVFSGVFQVFHGVFGMLEKGWLIFGRFRAAMALGATTGEAFGAIFPGIATAIEVITGPVGLIILAIAGLIAVFVALYKHNKDFHDNVIKAWDHIKKFALQMWPQIKDTFKEAFATIKALFVDIVGAVSFLWDHGMGQTIVKTIKVLWPIVTGVISGAFKIIKGLFEILHGALTGDWGKMWQGIKDIAGGAIKILGGVIGGIKELFKGPFDWVVNNVIKPFLGVWNSIADALGLDALKVDTSSWGKDNKPASKTAAATGASMNQHRAGFALGGLVGGVGTADTREIAATPGEFVLTRQAVAKIGLGPLYALIGSGGSRDGRHYGLGGEISKGIGSVVGAAGDVLSATAGKATMFTVEHLIDPIKSLVKSHLHKKGIEGMLRGGSLAMISNLENYAAGFLGQPKKYDRGGWLKPGGTLALNATGKHEAIMPEDVMVAAIRDAISGLGYGGGGDTYIFQVEGSVIRESELFDKAEKHIRRNSNRGSGVSAGRRN